MFVCVCVCDGEREFTGSHSTQAKKLDTSASQEPRNKLTCGSPVTAKELDSGVDVMQGSFTEGGDSILRV